MTDRVTVHIEAGVADVRLAREDKLNALDLAMFEALIETGKALATNRAVRAVVLSGNGRAFCAGLDFGSFAAMAGAPAAQTAAGDKPPPAPQARRPGGSLLQRDPDSLANTAQRAGWVWRELPVPVIAAVHGVAYGGGLQIACGADLRYVHPEAKLSVREIQWGLIPDMSGTQTLRHLLRLDVAKELTFTGRIVSGTEAVALGLCTRLADDPRAVALEAAQQIAKQSPDAIRAAKQLWNEAPLLSYADGLALEERLQLGLIGKPNQVEAVMANLHKREPKFTD
jgi:enoyl-CoA hydratase/carnithine racemase